MSETQPQLHHIEEFQDMVANYQISAASKQVLKKTNLVVMSGLAASGRNTVINRLVEHYNYFFIVSDTTRPPKLRNGRLEQNGVHYHFRSEEEMLKDIKAGKFLEVEIIHNQQVSGTSLRELERASRSGKIAIHDFEYGGANNVAQAKPDAHIIGLLPPSYDEWLRRLYARESINDKEFRNRLGTAEKVLKNMLAKPYFKIVINYDITACAENIIDIVEKGIYSPIQHRQGLELIGTMLAEVVTELGLV